MTDLWTEASRDIVAERQARNLEMAKAASQGTWEFLALAQSPEEYGDRVALAAEQITSTASANGVEVADLVGVFDSRFALMMEAKGNPFGDDDSSDDDDSDDSSDDSDSDSDDDDDDDSDSDNGGDDDDSDDDSDDKGKDSDDSGDDSGSDDDSDSAPPWANKYASLAQAIQSGANPLEWGGTPFAHSSARKEAADGAGGPEPVTDVNTPAPAVPGMQGGIAETTKPRQFPADGGGMDPTMAPGMGMDGIGAPPPDAPTDPAMNGGDIQQGADDLSPSDDAGRTAKLRAIATEVQKYNPTLSSAQCRKVASRVYDEYLVKHAEDMSPLLFGDRGGVADGPATEKVKNWSPPDFEPQKPSGDGTEDNGGNKGGGGGKPIPLGMPKVPGGGAAAGEAAEVGEAAAAMRMLPLLAL